MNEVVWIGWPEIIQNTRMGRLLIYKLMARERNPLPLAMTLDRKYILTKKDFDAWLEREVKDCRRNS